MTKTVSYLQEREGRCTFFQFSGQLTRMGTDGSYNKLYLVPWALRNCLPPYDKKRESFAMTIKCCHCWFRGHRADIESTAILRCRYRTRYQSCCSALIISQGLWTDSGDSDKNANLQSASPYAVHAREAFYWRMRWCLLPRSRLLHQHTNPFWPIEERKSTSVPTANF